MLITTISEFHIDIDLLNVSLTARHRMFLPLLNLDDFHPARRRRQHFPPKRWYPSSKLLDTSSQETVIHVSQVLRNKLSSVSHNVELTFSYLLSCKHFLLPYNKLKGLWNGIRGFECLRTNKAHIVLWSNGSTLHMNRPNSYPYRFISGTTQDYRHQLASLNLQNVNTTFDTVL
jgi:hypothetical protein